jgi:Fur family peroxide stress response transcriptional regulator
MTAIQTLTTSLQQAGLRITPQRIAICKLLVETDTHPTAAMIYETIHAQYPSLSLTTVYNTLDALTDLGVINVLGNAGDGAVHYDANIEPHINLACISCHKIVDIESPQVNHIHQDISSDLGYKLLGARVMFYGLCPACQTTPVQ